MKRSAFCRICQESIVYEDPSKKPMICNDCKSIRFGIFEDPNISDFEVIEINHAFRYVLLSEIAREGKISLTKSIDFVVRDIVEKYEIDLSRYIFCYRSDIDEMWQVYHHQDSFSGENRYRFAGNNIEEAKENIKIIFSFSLN